jgi:hypothetical protein
MRVEIGPVPLPSAQAWLDYASGVIGELRDSPRAVTSDVLDAFANYVDEWQATADTESERHDDVFRWNGVAKPETVEYLVFALYRLGLRLTDEEESGSREPPSPAAMKFQRVLVLSVLGALEREGEAEAHFVQQLREVWDTADERT